MRYFKSLILLSIFTVLLPIHLANAGIRVTTEEARFAEGTMNACTGQEKEVIECVQKALDGFAGGLTQADIPQLTPKAAPIIQKAANDLKRATSKAAALSVLNRVKATIRGLAAKRSGQPQAIYKRISITLSRALSVIKRKA